MLRRLKADVLKSLPVKTVVVNTITMTEHQLTRYETLSNEIKEAAQNKETSENNHMMWVMMLRKLTNHPLLLRYHFEASNSMVVNNFLCFNVFIFIYNFRTKNCTKWQSCWRQTRLTNKKINNTLPRIYPLCLILICTNCVQPIRYTFFVDYYCYTIVLNS